MVIELIKELAIIVLVVFVLIPELFVMVCQAIAAPFWLLWQIVKLFKKIIPLIFLASCATQAVPVAVTGKLAIVKNRIKFERTGKEVVLPDTVINCTVVTYKRLPKNKIQ